MKPASVIFLVISVLIIAIGLGLCFFAQNKADNEGIELFDTSADSEGDVVETIEFEEHDIGRIALNLTECEIYISKGDRSYAELRNFAAGTFAQSFTNQSFSVDDTISISSIFSFAENGFEFKGIRQYLQYYNSSFANREKEEKKKQINIYISPDDQIKIFDIEVKTGTVTLTDLTKRAAYNVRIGTGDLTAENLAPSSQIDAIITKGDVGITCKSIEHVSAKISEGDFLAAIQSPDIQTYDLNVVNGSVIFLGGDVTPAFKIEHPISSTSIQAEVQNGNINISDISKANQTEASG